MGRKGRYLRHGYLQGKQEGVERRGRGAAMERSGAIFTPTIASANGFLLLILRNADNTSHYPLADISSTGPGPVQPLIMLFVTF